MYSSCSPVLLLFSCSPPVLLLFSSLLLFSCCTPPAITPPGAFPFPFFTFFDLLPSFFFPYFLSKEDCPVLPWFSLQKMEYEGDLFPSFLRGPSAGSASLAEIRDQLAVSCSLPPTFLTLEQSLGLFCDLWFITWRDNGASLEAIDASGVPAAFKLVKEVILGWGKTGPGGATVIAESRSTIDTPASVVIVRELVVLLKQLLEGIVVGEEYAGSLSVVVSRISQIAWLGIISEADRPTVLQPAAKNLEYLIALLEENKEVVLKRWKVVERPIKLPQGNGRPTPIFQVHFLLQDLLSHNCYLLSLGQRYALLFCSIRMLMMALMSPLHFKRTLQLAADALQTARDGVKASKDNIFAWEVVGCLQYETQNYAEALGCFSKCIELVSGVKARALLTAHESKIRNMAGCCHVALKNPHRAIDEFKAALKLDLSNVRAMFNAALQYQALDNHQAFISMVIFFILLFVR